MSKDIHCPLQLNRKAIDSIDRELVRLLNRRVLRDSGSDKDAVPDEVTRFNSGPLSDEGLRAIYRALMPDGLDSQARLTDPAEVDQLDSRIVELLNQRAKNAGQIGRIKHTNEADYYDPTREAQVMDRVCELNPGPLSKQTIRSVYREVISSSIALEKRLVIAYLGPEATFTHQAAISKFGVSLRYRPIKTIPEVFAQIESFKADYGVVPIENSTEGAVFHSMDMLVESDLHICSQICLPIEHCLISNAPLSEISEVRSKDQALGQCREWLLKHLPHSSEVDVVSTAEAVRTAGERPGVAAIAGRLAAQHYGVPIQAYGIQDRRENMTRFLVMGRTRAKPFGNNRDKTGLVISLKDEVGALEKVLGAFAKRGINLSKIESRPNRKKAWEYYFFIDLVGHYEDAHVRSALDELREYCPFVKWLGSYPTLDS